MFIESIRGTHFHRSPSYRQTKRAYVSRVKIVEVLPPKSEMTIAKIEAIRSLAMKADVLSIPSHPMGNLRMSNIDCFDQAGLDGNKTIIHYTVRGKRWPTIESDLLKMNQIGIGKVLIVRGDEPKFSVEDPKSDIDSVDVVAFIKNRLNQGISWNGKRVGKATTFKVGCAVNITPKDGGLFQQNRLTQKINAGADFFITHPVFNQEKALEFLDSHQYFFGKIINQLYCGLIPFSTQKQLHYFANIPEMDLSKKMISELNQIPKGDVEQFRKRSVELTMDVAEALINRSVVSGFHIVTGSSDSKAAMELLDALNLNGL